MAGKKSSGLVSREVLSESVKKFAKRSDVRLSEDPVVDMATDKVEGLLSKTFRVKAFYSFDGEEEVRTKNLIFKKMPDTEFQRNFVNEGRMFEKEALYYGNVVPMLKKLSAGSFDVPLPECYHVTHDGIDDVIVMEDLADYGYRTPDSVYQPEGLDLAHCTLAMRCLGRLHGLGVAAERSLPPEKGGWLKVFPTFAKESWFLSREEGEKAYPTDSMVKNAMKNLAKLLKEVEGPPMEAEASGLLEKAVQMAWKTCCRLVERGGDGFDILCHGDYYANNLMFRHESDASGEMIPVEAKVIDFQVTRYSHPAIDILYFMHLGTTKSLRDAHLEELLAVYHEFFAETLDALGVGPPPITLSELIRDVQGKYKPFGVVIGSAVVPNLLLVNISVPNSIEDIFMTGYAPVVNERFKKDPKFRSRIEELIREFVDVAFPNGPNALEGSPFVDSHP